MDVGVITGIVGFLSLLVIMALGVPIGVSCALIGFVGLVFLTSSFNYGLNVLMIVPYHAVASWGFLVFPLFILMGEYALKGGIGDDAYRVAKLWIGRVRGGLGMATTAGCTIFAAASGSSLATAATFTSFALPEMKKAGYSTSFAAGCIASSGTFAAMIPPSGMMVIYTIFTGVSLGQLMMAGWIPGIMAAVSFFALIYIIVHVNPSIAPVVAVQDMPFWQKVKESRYLISIGIVMVIIMAGIYFGIFTPVEAGGVGGFATLVICAVRRSLNWNVLKNSLLSAARTSSMVFFIIIGAFIFGRFLAVSGLTKYLSTLMQGMGSPMMVIIMMMLSYLVLGTFFDATGMLSITLPLYYPIVESLGFSGVWFGILAIKVCEIGWLTPPLGLNAITVFGTARGQIANVTEVYKGCAPFILADVVVLILLVAFPQISLFLPSKMFGA